MHRFTDVFAGVTHTLASVSLVALALAIALHLAKVVAEARAWHRIVSHTHHCENVRFTNTLGPVQVEARRPHGVTFEGRPSEALAPRSS